LTSAGVVATEIGTQSIYPTSIILATLVNISALHLSISLVTWFALADILSRKITTLGILHTLGGKGRDSTLVNISTIMPIALISREAGAVIATNVVSAVSEHITWPVLALIVIRHRTTLSTPAVIAVTLAV
jgi:hypothetical protein